MSSSSGFLGNLPVLDAKNWDKWCIQMKVIFGFQEVSEVIEDGIPSLGEHPTEAERRDYREAKKKDCKALFLLHQSVDDSHFQKISSAKTSQEAWKILEQSHSGGDKVKKARLQTLKRQFELLKMMDSETIADYVNRVVSLSNSMRRCDYEVKVSDINEKIMRSLLKKFDYFACAIEESKDVGSMATENLQSTLEIYEQKIMERDTEDIQEQALLVQKFKKGDARKNDQKGKGKGKGKTHSIGKPDRMESISNDENDKPKTQKKKFDKKKIQCYNCKKWGHFADECWFGEGKDKRPKSWHKEEEAYTAEEENSQDDEP
ncbi:unnamed protein product, partial [Cuscuta epithymum]